MEAAFALCQQEHAKGGTNLLKPACRLLAEIEETLTTNDVPTACGLLVVAFRQPWAPENGEALEAAFVLVQQEHMLRGGKHLLKDHSRLDAEIGETLATQDVATERGLLMVAVRPCRLRLD